MGGLKGGVILLAVNINGMIEKSTSVTFSTRLTVWVQACIIVHAEQHVSGVPPC